MSSIVPIANAIGAGIKDAATYSAKAAARANGVSAASQAAQGAFNQQSANTANGLGSDRLLGQYAFNSGQAASANEFTQAMWNQSAAYNDAAWERAAAWNEAMMERQMEFNHNEAKLNREWQQQMAETAYQRAVTDMEKAGINPILASGGVSVGSGGGSAASIGGTQMSPSSMSGAQGAMASGGLLNGISASEGNFSGQMEYMAGILGLMSAVVQGIGSAATAFSQLGLAGQGGKEGYSFANFIGDLVEGNTTSMKKQSKNPNTSWNQFQDWIFKKATGHSKWDNGNYNPYDKE